jgi:hypothetical protein
MLKRFWNKNWLMHKVIGLICLMMGAWGFCSSLFSDSYTINLHINQTLSIQQPKELLTFASAKLLSNQTVLEIKNPTILQRLFWPNENDFEPLVWLVVFITGVVVLKIFMSLGPQIVFQKDNLNWLNLLCGSYITCFFIFHFSGYFINSQVQALTNEQLTYNRFGNAHTSNLVWIGFLFVFIYQLYKRGLDLQESKG